MANQISPAQQAKTASTHRPAKVSTRFLSNAADTGTVTIPAGRFFF